MTTPRERAEQYRRGDVLWRTEAGHPVVALPPGSLVLTADEAETVREALGWGYNIGECAEHPEHLMGAEHAARKAFPLLSPRSNVETSAE